MKPKIRKFGTGTISFEISDITLRQRPVYLIFEEGFVGKWKAVRIQSNGDVLVHSRTANTPNEALEFLSEVAMDLA